MLADHYVFGMSVEGYNQEGKKSLVTQGWRDQLCKEQTYGSSHCFHLVNKLIQNNERPRHKYMYHRENTGRTAQPILLQFPLSFYNVVYRCEFEINI